MKIVFYSTCSNVNDESSVFLQQFPSCCENWENSIVAKNNEIIIVTQKPASFLCDIEKNQLVKKCNSVKYIFRDEDKPKDFARVIIDLKPDMAIAMTFWVRPFDWLAVQDSLVGNELKSAGIKTYCQKLETAVDCFDKWRTHSLLQQHGFPCAKAVYVHHELYMNAGHRRELKTNVYKTSVLQQIKNLRFPVIIKDTTGLSSFGMDKVDTYEEVLGILQSKRFTSDRVVEEYISGEQLGCEIHGADGNYRIFSPFYISTNQYGITSPKQNVKFGPVNEEKYKVTELKNMLLELAVKLEFSGIVQADLVFDGNRWFVIEINTRLSGMSNTYSVSAGKTIYDLVFEAVNLKSSELNPPQKFVLDIKMPLCEEKVFEDLKNNCGVKFISRTINPAARQFREEGFVQLIAGGTDSTGELKKIYESIKEKLPPEEQILCESFLN